MGNSLHEQLLKAGLVDKKQAQAAQKAKQRKQKQQRHSKKQATQDSASRIAKAARDKAAQRDRELNRQLQEARQRKAAEAQIRQLMEAHGEDLEAGDIAYHFADHGKLRRLHVTPRQQRQLSSGQLGIVKSSQQYALVPAAVVEKIRRRDAECVIVLNTADQPEDADDPYAEFKVPDDLMW